MGVEEGERAKETERGGGQGCFPFSQLIDSQMSAVGFVVVVKHSRILLPSKNKQTNKKYTHASK